MVTSVERPFLGGFGQKTTPKKPKKPACVKLYATSKNEVKNRGHITVVANISEYCDMTPIILGSDRLNSHLRILDAKSSLSLITYE